MSNAVRLSGMSLHLLNVEQLWRTFTGVLDNSRVQVWLTFAGLADADALPLFPGVVDRHTWNRSALDVSLIDASFCLHRNLSIAIGGQYFPSAPQASRSQFIPIVLGLAVDAPTIQVSGGAQGTLAFVIGSLTLELLLVELGAPFPTSGTVSIGAETAVTYASRDLVLVSGVTYLRLGGLARAGSTSHDVGTVVTLTSGSFVYLIGYEVSSVSAVRDNGAIVNPGDYTLETVQADRPVSVLIFAAQRGRITVDVNGPNVDSAERLVNGDFELGDASGWTLGAGTVDVADSAPLPPVGRYRAALTGPGVGVDGTLYQDFPTIPGATFLLRLTYQNAQSSGALNLLTNGSFEAGDLTGWTIGQQFAGTVYGVVRAHAPAGTYDGTFGTLPLYQGAAAHDTSYLEVTGHSNPWRLEVYQDIAVVPGATYVFSGFEWAGAAETNLGTDVYLPGPGLAGSYVTRLGEYALGIPGNPTLYGAGSLGSSQPGVLSALPTGWRGGNQVSFMATTATTRITLVARGTFQGLQPQPICLDGVHLEQTDQFPRSVAGYSVGTPTTPAQFLSPALDTIYAWTPVEASWQTTEAVGRLTLRSQQNAGTLPSYFDRLSVRLGYNPTGLGGENPVNTMQYVLDTFLEEAVYDAANFADAAQRVMAWKFGAVLTNPGDSRALLQRMAYQCGSLLFQDGAGVFKVAVLHGTPAVQMGFDMTNIVEDSCTVGFEAMDNVYSDLYVWFAAKTGGATSSSDFQGVVYATPTATTANSAPGLVTQCSAARALYGREHRLDYFADFIQDVGTAHLLLLWLVSRLTIRQTLLTFRTWLDGIQPELGDRVQITHPLLSADDDPVVCEVIGQHVDFATMQVELVVRTLTLAGWRAEFEADPGPPVPSGAGCQRIVDDAALSAGLLACWDLDEADEDRLDHVGGAVLHQASFVPGVPGHIGQAAAFYGGEEQYLYGGDLLPDLEMHDFTLAFWVRLRTFPVFSGTLVSNGPSTVPGDFHFTVYVNSSGTVGLEIHNGTDAGVLSATALQVGEWTLVTLWQTVTGDTTQMSIQLNQDALATNTGTIVSLAALVPQFCMGAMGGTSGGPALYPLDGDLDSVMAWNRALSEAERAVVWNGGAG